MIGQGCDVLDARGRLAWSIESSDTIPVFKELMPFKLTLPSEIYTLENSACPKDKAENSITSTTDITSDGTTSLKFPSDLVTGQTYTGTKV